MRLVVGTAAAKKHAEGVHAAAAVAVAAERFLAKAVIQLALLRVREHLVGILGFLEGLAVAALVRMQPPRSLLVGLGEQKRKKKEKRKEKKKKTRETTMSVFKHKKSGKIE